ncbi:MAG TPA: ATP-binding cassette domain-containing protein [Acidimicrobiales bacterium]|jgi:macrolide transport system ATP-binding/permease protein
MSTRTTLTARGITVTHGKRPVLTDVDLTVAPGHRVGVIGPNGVGKSTLLRVLAGLNGPSGVASTWRRPAPWWGICRRSPSGDRRKPSPPSSPAAPA